MFKGLTHTWSVHICDRKTTNVWKNKQNSAENYLSG